MSELDPHSTALLEALRSEAPDADPKERVRARLAASGVLGVSALAAAQAPALALAKPAGWLGLTKLMVLGTGVLAVGTLAVVTVTHTRQAPTEVAAGARPVAASPLASTLPAPVLPSREREGSEPVAEVAASQATPALTESRQRKVRHSRRSPVEALTLPEPASSTLAAESTLLARAVRALNDGHTDEAHALLREHAERFPGGLLVRERELALARLDAANRP
jgi:hypothetical protein